MRDSVEKFSVQQKMSKKAVLKEWKSEKKKFTAQFLL